MMRSLKSIRTDLNLNQQEMAKLLGISYATYQKKEQGISPLLARELRIISEKSGVEEKLIEIPC